MWAVAVTCCVCGVRCRELAGTSGVSGETRDMRGLGRTPPDKWLAALAGRQWGVVSLGQLRALGLSQDAVERRARLGRLRRVHRGVYAVGGAVLPREGRWLAAVLACGDRAVLSHLSAAVHWNPSYDAPNRRSPPRVPAGRPGDPPAPLYSLDAQDTTSHPGIPITTVHRTLLDIAAQVPDHHLERALAQAERLELYDHRAIEDVIARANGHRATKRLSQAIQDDPQFTRSDWRRACAGSPANMACPAREITSSSMPPTTPASRSTLLSGAPPRHDSGARTPTPHRGAGLRSGRARTPP